MTRTGSPDPRNDRICITSSCPRQFVVASPSSALRRQQQSRLLVPFSAHHHGPGHASDFVGERDGSDLDRPAFHDAREPGPLGAMLPSIADDRHGAGNEQPSQISIALL